MKDMTSLPQQPHQTFKPSAINCFCHLSTSQQNRAQSRWRCVLGVLSVQQMPALKRNFASFDAALKLHLNFCRKTLLKLIVRGLGTNESPVGCVLLKPCLDLQT